MIVTLHAHRPIEATRYIKKRLSPTCRAFYLVTEPRRL